MKKILAFFCTLVFISSLLPTSQSISVEKTSQILQKGNILYVGGSGPGNYSSIQEAVNAAFSDDTVFVYDDSSPYYENIIIEKSISLIGENRETTVILGDENTDGIIVNISANDVSVSGFTIQPTEGQPAGIVVGKNYTYPDYWNIAILQNVTIFDNTIKNTGWAGIFGIRLKNGNISENDVENCNGDGILLYISSSTTITNNIVSNCSSRGINIDGLWGPYRLMNYRNPVPENNIISQNTISSNRWGIELNSGPMNTKISDNNIIGNHEIGIQIIDASKTEITRNNLINNSKNAYFMAIMILRYPRLVLNSWDGNYWGESTKALMRIDVLFISSSSHVYLLIYRFLTFR